MSFKLRATELDPQVTTLGSVLADLHRRRVVWVGPRELARVEVLLRSRESWQVGELASSLASLLAVDAEQWEAVEAAVRAVATGRENAEPSFEEGWTGEEATWGAQVKLEQPLPGRAERLHALVDHARRRVLLRVLGVRGRAWALWLALLLVIGVAGVPLALRSVEPPPPASDPPTLVEEPDEIVLKPGDLEGPVARLMLVEPSGYKRFPLQGVFPPFAIASSVVLVVLSMALCWLGVGWLGLPRSLIAARDHAARRRLDERAEGALAGPGTGAVYRVDRFPPLPESAVDDAATLISRRLPAGLRDELDVRATIDQAIRAGGRLTPVLAPGARPPELLVLLDVEAGDHPFLDGALQVLERWRRSGVRMEVHRFSFRLEPRLLDRLARRTEGMPLLLLSRLKAPGDTRSSGMRWMRLLRRWPRRAYVDLDPRAPSSRRDASERALRELAATGTRRYPFTPDGLVTAARALNAGDHQDRPPREEPLPPMEEVQSAVRAWAYVASLVPDPTWAQLEVIRRHFPEIRAALPSPRCAALLLDFVAQESQGGRLAGESLADNGRKLFIPDPVAARWREACRAEDQRRHAGDADARLEVRARRLLIDQLRGATPSTPLERAERQLKLALHQAILDPTTTDELLRELAENPLADELAEELRAELELQRARGLVLRGGFRKNDAETLGAALDADAPPRVPLARLVHPTRAQRPQRAQSAAIGVVLLSWIALAAVSALRGDLVEVEGGVLRPAEWRLVRTDWQPLALVPIQAGTFQMGSPSSEAGRGSDETLHEVSVGAFELCRTEVTRAQWQAIVADEDAKDCREGCEPDMPVQKVSWLDAVRFLNGLSDRENLGRCYVEEKSGAVRWDRSCVGYRLPTEAEWEYAARAGTRSPWSWGWSTVDADRAAWFFENSAMRVREVASLSPNPWGVYDMHGNVWEWVWDWYGPYEVSISMDEGGPETGNSRVLRGGSFAFKPADLRSARRLRNEPTLQRNGIGFRCARGRHASGDSGRYPLGGVD